jgi:hypothetical protein
MRGRIAWSFFAWALCPVLSAENVTDTGACLASAGPGYSAQRKLDPHVRRGDFDGDGKSDQAVVVTRGRKQGVLVCWGSGARPAVLGAGVAFHEMTDLDFTEWRLHSHKQRVARGFGAGRPPALLGDALLLEWESGSGIVYWNGKRFAWYQQGD